MNLQLFLLLLSISFTFPTTTTSQSINIDNAQENVEIVPLHHRDDNAENLMTIRGGKSKTSYSPTQTPTISPTIGKSKSAYPSSASINYPSSSPSSSSEVGTNQPSSFSDGSSSSSSPTSSPSILPDSNNPTPSPSSNSSTNNIITTTNGNNGETAAVAWSLSLASAAILLAGGGVGYKKLLEEQKRRDDDVTASNQDIASNLFRFGFGGAGLFGRSNAIVTIGGSEDSEDDSVLAGESIISETSDIYTTSNNAGNGDDDLYGDEVSYTDSELTRENHDIILVVDSNGNVEEHHEIGQNAIDERRGNNEFSEA